MQLAAGVGAGNMVPLAAALEAEEELRTKLQVVEEERAAALQAAAEKETELASLRQLLRTGSSLSPPKAGSGVPVGTTTTTIITTTTTAGTAVGIAPGTPAAMMKTTSAGVAACKEPVLDSKTSSFAEQVPAHKGAGGILGPLWMAPNMTVEDIPVAAFAIATHAFDAYETGGMEGVHYLSFAVGDRIEIVEREGDWWMGRLSDEVGWFPSSFTDGEEKRMAGVSEDHPSVAPESTKGSTDQQGKTHACAWALPRTIPQKALDYGLRNDTEEETVVHV
jgi:hypothetical protein